MNDLALSAPLPSPPDSPRHPWGWICTQNPFYLISALLVLWGVQSSVMPELRVEQVVTLWVITAGYTALVALSTIVVIRWARDWADARTLLLIIPMFCVALSMLFDEFLLQSANEAAILLLLSYAFSILCFEIVLASCQIRLTIGVKGVYYLILTTLYVYPILLLTLSRQTSSDTVLALSLFPVIMSIEFLLLIPTMRGAQSRMSQSGTPYFFPLFPYSLFAILLVVVMLRLYLLALAFAPGWNYVLLAPSNFIPFILAGGLLLLELSHRAHSETCKSWSLLTGPIVLGLAWFPTPTLMNPEVMAPSPVVSIWLCAMFYLWAVVRQARLADWGMVATLGIASMNTTLPNLIEFSSTLPLILAGLFLAWRGIRLTSGLRIAAGGGLLAEAVVTYFAPLDAETHILFVTNGICLAVIAVHALVGRDWLDTWRDFSLIGLVVAFGFTLFATDFAAAFQAWQAWGIYATTLSGGLLFYGRLFRHRLALILGWAVMAVSATFSLFFLIHRLRSTFLHRGLTALLVGLASLAIGLLVTFRKSVRLARVSDSNHHE